MKRSIWIILAVSALVRLLFGWYSIGFDHPNEVYRTLEPLAGLQGYATHLPFEWTDHMLSSLPIRAQFQLLKLAEAAGITEALSQLRFLHILYGVLSLIQVVCTWRLVWLATCSLRVAFAASAFVGLWPELVYQSVRLMDYSLEASFLAAAVLCVFGQWKRHAQLLAAVGGSILGSLFFVRYQSGLHLISIALLLVYERLQTRKGTRLGFFVSAYALSLLGLALLESGGIVDFLLPFRNYWHFNITLDGAAKGYGIEPWHRYATETFKFFGALPFFLLIGFGFVHTSSRKILFLSAFPIFILSCLQHKEGRFIFGNLFLIVPAAACGWFYSYRSLTRRVLAQWTCVLAGVISVLVGAAVSGMRVKDRFALHVADSVEFAEVGRAIARVSSKNEVNLCVFLNSGDSPGAFLLRTKGRLSYLTECTTLSKFHFYLLTNNLDANRTLWKGRRWALSDLSTD